MLIVLCHEEYETFDSPFLVVENPRLCGRRLKECVQCVENMYMKYEEQGMQGFFQQTLPLLGV